MYLKIDLFAISSRYGIPAQKVSHPMLYNLTVESVILILKVNSSLEYPRLDMHAWGHEIIPIPAPHTIYFVLILPPAVRRYRGTATEIVPITGYYRGFTAVINVNFINSCPHYRRYRGINGNPFPITAVGNICAGLYPRLIAYYR